MTIFNFGVYQCPCCGSVLEQELQRLPPFCCGREMTKTGERLAPHAELLVPASVAQRWVKTVGSQVTEHEPPRTGNFVNQPL